MSGLFFYHLRTSFVRNQHIDSRATRVTDSRATRRDSYAHYAFIHVDVHFKYPGISASDHGSAVMAHARSASRTLLSRAVTSHETCCSEFRGSVLAFLSYNSKPADVNWPQKPCISLGDCCSRPHLFSLAAWVRLVISLSYHLTRARRRARAAPGFAR